MGVPKLYRWLCERYPCICEVIIETQIPEFDNLYLDMNGIIHTCCHIVYNEGNVSVQEGEIFKAILHYIEFLFRMIKPKKLLFIAVDGVAPRAKMNQQRSRRFQAARDADNLSKKVSDDVAVPPEHSHQRFDSNCISPGTVFMDKLQDALKKFVHNKLSSDPLWRNREVILSGHDVPGEGEHKIQDFLRHRRSNGDYNPDLRHCFYGLDADLIILGLASHEHHATLLREQINFTRGKKSVFSPEETTFTLFHLPLLRDYIKLEFQELKENLSVTFDFERILDDWILLTFLLGNDFMPNIPNVHIDSHALPIMWDIYKRLLPELDGYLTERGNLNFSQFIKYVQELSKLDLYWFKSKTERKPRTINYSSRRRQMGKNCETTTNGNVPTEEDVVLPLGVGGLEIEDDSAVEEDLGLTGYSLNVDQRPCAPNEDAGGFFTGLDDSLFQEETIDENEVERNRIADMERFDLYRYNYYKRKLKMDTKEYPDGLTNLVREYIRGIEWTLAYYFKGVPSWSWYYPYYYAPYVFDIAACDMEAVETGADLEYDEPLLPQEQLMAILPSASYALIPECYRPLVLDVNSPIAAFYPRQFRTDRNAKRQKWEALVILPFVDIPCLLAALTPLSSQLTTDEKRRNVHGSHLLYSNVNASLVHMEMVDPHLLRSTGVQDDKGSTSAASVNASWNDFPSLDQLSFTSCLKHGVVRIFERTTRSDSVILKVDTPQSTIDDIASAVLGRGIFLRWPLVVEAKIMSVMSSDKRLQLENSYLSGSLVSSDKHDIKMVTSSVDDKETFAKTSADLMRKCKEHRGLEVTAMDVLLFGHVLVGRKKVWMKDGDGIDVMKEVKQWSSQCEAFLWQLSVPSISPWCGSPDGCTLTDLFPTGSTVFCNDGENYGEMGEVISVVMPENMINVNLRQLSEPNLEIVDKEEELPSEQYLSAAELGTRLGIPGHLVTAFLGSLYVECKGGRFKFNVGIGLLTTVRSNEEVLGWLKRTEDGCRFSVRLAEIVPEYWATCPPVYNFFAAHPEKRQGSEEEVFGRRAEAQLKALSSYLKQLPFVNAPRVLVGSRVLSAGAVRAVECAIDAHNSESAVEEMEEYCLAHSQLYREMNCVGRVYPDPTTECALLDRVVNVRSGFSVPVGLRGTIIGVIVRNRGNDVYYCTETVYEVLFDKEFDGACSVRASGPRGFILPQDAFINISHGYRQSRSI